MPSASVKSFHGLVYSVSECIACSLMLVSKCSWAYRSLGLRLPKRERNLTTYVGWNGRKRMACARRLTRNLLQ